MTLQEFKKYDKSCYYMQDVKYQTYSFYANDTIFLENNPNFEFICQIELSNINTVYQIFENNFFDLFKYSDVEDWYKNGNRYLVKKQQQNNNLEIINKKYIGFKAGIDEINFYILEEMLGEISEEAESYFENSLILSKIGGYPSWLQRIELPKNFNDTDFVLQICFESKQDVQFPSRFGDGCIYLFDNGQDIACVYQR